MSESRTSSPQALAHGVTRMAGRDPNEPHRAATPLELLFDLTFVVGFRVAAEQLAHLLAESHPASGLVGFGFAMFAVCWAWINFSWFASAYDTDDWPFRVATMVQMVGVLIFTLGLPEVFGSIDHRPHLHNAVAVAGYVVMRIAMGFQWLRAAAQDPARRSACLTYLTTILVAQASWGPAAVRGGLSIGPGDPAVDGAAGPDRAGRPLDRRDPQGRDPLARSPPRRALRAAGHHRAG
jgi:low temperature requirement protein LtrA